MGFRALREGGEGVRLQGSLRPDPAAASRWVSPRWRCFLVQCRKVGWIIDVRYGMKRTPNKGVIVPSYELGSESRTPNTHSAAIGSPSS